ncbi:hypothetical protein Trydic_g8413 [Trypoxylus dichotomus]
MRNPPHNVPHRSPVSWTTPASDTLQTPHLPSTPEHSFPREVTDLIRKGNRLQKQCQRTLHPLLKEEYNRITRRTKAALDEFHNQRWDNFMIHSAFAKAVKVMKKTASSLPPIYGARGVAFTTEDKAKAFAETLQQQCSPVYENANVNHTSPATTDIVR